MTYDIIKIAHLVAMVLWMGAAFTVPLVALMLSRYADAPQSAAIKALRQAHLWLGGIGILATWLFGLTLLSLGGWLDARWMMAKLLLVAVLSGLHGALSGKLKKAAWDGNGVPAGFLWLLLSFHAVGLLAVVSLVVTKPF